MTKRQELQGSRKVDHATASLTKTWIDRELAGSEFRDVRLNRPFRKLFEQLSEGTGESIPFARTGQTQKQRTVFSPTRALAKGTLS
jgi:hypothetical protein